LISSHVELISYSTVFMKYWAGLHDEGDADDLRAGADGLLRLASATTPQVRSSQGGARRMNSPLRIRDASMDDDADAMDLGEHEG
jgi:hypothetical protein